MLNKIIICAAAIFILAPVSFCSNDHKISADHIIYAKARIVSIEKIHPHEGNRDLVETHIKLKIIDGELKGKVKTAVFGGESDLPKEMTYKPGTALFVGISRTDAEGSVEHISLYDTDNTIGVIAVIIILVVSIIAVGGIKGAASMGALIFTIVLIFMILIPGTLKGYPPLPIAIAISLVSIMVTLPIITGLKLKTAAAVIGAASGVLLSAALAIASGYIMHLSGIVTNEMLTVFYAADVNIDLRGLALSGMIISALGAIMDICVSIASSANEIYNANPKISDRDAFKSVLTIGQDTLGTMVNTLILSYIGSSLSLVLFIAIRLKPGIPFWMIVNYNPVLSEIVKSVVGSVGMFMAIPITAYVSIKLMSRYKKRSEIS